jgi:hypothetical protein
MRFSLWMLLVFCLALAIGCNDPESTNDSGSNGVAANADGDRKQGHTHDDALVWQRSDIDHQGYVISLGHHGKQLFAGHKAEPAVIITKGGEAVADAKVFVTLLDAAGEDVITVQQATVYEPATAEEPAHYAQASVKIPADATKLTLRYRIELSEAGEFSEDVIIEVSKH